MDQTTTIPDGKPLQILIVEDDTDSAQSLAALLGLSGYVVQVAADGPAALASAAATAPDVVLLDLGLPRMSGYEVARQLRAQNFKRRPLIIAVTGYGDQSERVRSYEVGIDLHLVKPVDFDELHTLLRRFQDITPQQKT